MARAIGESDGSGGSRPVQGDDGRRFMLVRQDTHGSRYLIVDDLSEADAEAALKTLLGQQTKPHHQTYVIYGYVAARRREFMAAMAIIE